MKRGLSQAGTSPSKRVAHGYKGDVALPKRAPEDVNNLLLKLRAAEEKALKFEHRTALAELKNETIEAQMEKVILENRVLRAGLGARFLLPKSRPKKRAFVRDESQGSASERFPWLTTKSYNLPQAAMERITSFLCDDELFLFRELSLLFYTAYYEQVVKCTKFPEVDAFEFHYKGAAFNALRALRLARHGRRYPNVEFLDVHQVEMPAELIMAIRRYNFPSLSVLSLEFKLGSLNSLPGNANLVALRVSVTQAEDGDFINEGKFPKLRQLRPMNKPNDPLVKIGPHKAIEYLELYCGTDFTGMLVGKKSFPRLRFLESEFDVPAMVKIRLQNEGVELVISS